MMQQGLALYGMLLCACAVLCYTAAKHADLPDARSDHSLPSTQLGLLCGIDWHAIS